MSKIGLKGKAGAHKVMLMAAIAFNLRKYMKFEPVKVKTMALAIQRKQVHTFMPFYLLLLVLFFLKKPKNQSLIPETLYRLRKRDIKRKVVQQPPPIFEAVAFHSHESQVLCYTLTVVFV